jgi:DNA protecting protein DprA
MDGPSTQLQALYLLAQARNFSSAHIPRVITQLGSLEALLTAPELELRNLEFAGGMNQRLIEARAGCDPLADIAALAGKGVALCGLGLPGYPELLAQIPDAPVMLFCKGDMALLDGAGIAIVGSRKCSERGLELAGEFGAALGGAGVCVVSGMALGIDGSAHRGALDSGGPTVAVLGCGVDVIYPPDHHQLYERICAGGAVISEYPPGTPPLGDHFPQRNRVISGLTRGVLVVEGTLGSGSLITARTAIEQGREVFAVPGPVKSPYTKGTHHLIKTGQAKLAETADDILLEFGTSLAALRKQRYAPGLFDPGSACVTTASGVADTPDHSGAGLRARHLDAGRDARATAEDDDKAVRASGKPGGIRAVRHEALPEAEQRALEAISYEGSHVNEVLRKLGLTTAECIAHLTMLEIKGLITSAQGGYYTRV